MSEPHDPMTRCRFEKGTTYPTRGGLVTFTVTRISDALLFGHEDRAGSNFVGPSTRLTNGRIRLHRQDPLDLMLEDGTDPEAANDTDPPKAA